MSDNPLANLDEETQRKIQEMQILEQNFQQLMMQKQAFSMESNETGIALAELDKSSGDVFKIVGGQIVIKSSKDNLIKELTRKKELIDLRLKNIEKQEEEFSNRLEILRKEVIEKIQSKK